MGPNTSFETVGDMVNENVFCEECGAAVPRSAKYCTGCGRVLTPCPTDSYVSAPASTTPAASPITHTTGGLDESPPARPYNPGAQTYRSKAWIYYTVLAILSLVAVFTGKPAGLAGTMLCGAYASYLYNGGRVVIWLW